MADSRKHVDILKIVKTNKEARFIQGRKKILVGSIRRNPCRDDNARPPGQREQVVGVLGEQRVGVHIADRHWLMCN